jgi:NAD(P)-dependent dehydrogenase (short-subunit alcohol dehydrogenase family)
MTDITGRSVLVIGASAGIGRSAAAWFAREGAKVMAVGRREPQLQELAATVSMEICAADLTVEGEAQRVIDATVAAFGAIDIIVYSAAVSPIATLDQLTRDVWLRVLDTNVVAPSMLIQTALPHLSADSIVAVLSSETVGRPRRGLVHYGCSKAAVEELVVGWRTENPDHRFAIVRVGATGDTEFGREFDGELLTACLDDWMSAGHMHEALMVSDDVGGTLAEILAIGLTHPALVITDFAIRPPGKLLTLG